MAITSSTLTGNTVSNITTTTVDVTFSASVTGTSFGATEVVYITSGGTQYGGALATMASVGTTTTTRSTGSVTATITGLSASTSYTGALHLRGVTSGSDIRIGTSFTFTTASPPPPPTLYSYPSLSGTPISGNSISASAGSYSNGSIATKIAYATSANTGSWVNGTTTAPNTRTTPYTVTDTDASSPPYYFAAVDAVTSNGTIYYYFSSQYISYLKVSFDSQSGTAASSIAYIANSSSPNSITLPSTSRSGYTFNGWYTAASGGTYAGGASSTYTPSTSSSTTLYAQWTATPPSQISGPTLYGTAVSGTSLTVAGGSYNNASSVTTKVAYNIANSFVNGTTQPTTQITPYTVNDVDARYQPYYFAAVDVVVGNNGTTYYYYSGSIVSKLKVSFNSQSGSSVSDISYVAASPANSISLPYTSRSGYTFNGWYTAASGGTYVGGAYSSYTPSTNASTTLYAQWTALPPSQNYGPTLYGSDTVGSVLTVSSGSYNYASSVITKVAYSTTNSFISGSTTPIPSTQITPYTIVNLDAAAPPYYFVAVDVVYGTNGQTYYYYSSGYVLSKLQVTFDSQGGSSANAISYVANSTSPNYITLPYTSRAGYTFNGWYTAASGGTRVGGIYESYAPPVSGSIGLYAQWSIIPISQYYAPTLSGSGIAGTSLSVSSGGYSNGTVVGNLIAYNTSNSFISGTTTPPNPYQTSPYTVTVSDATNPLYYFAAVDVVQNGAGTNYYYYSSSIASGFQITYVYDNGLSNGYQTFYSASTNPSITLPVPTKTGYNFVGWFTDPTAGTQVQSPYTPSNANITLYARWTAKTYTLYYNANGGSVSPLSKTVTYNLEYGSLPVPSRPGYTFIGWYTDPVNGSEVLSSNKYLTDGDSTIYAHWQGNPYLVYLYPNYPLGGTSDSVYSIKNVLFDSAYGTLPVLTRTGYVFNGWFTQASGGTQVFATTIYTSSSDTNIFAQWTASLPVFSDQAITTSAYLNIDFNTVLDHTVTASPVTSYSIVYSGTGLNPTSWLSIAKESNSNNGILSGKPTQIGTYTFIVRASNQGGGDTNSGLITIVVYPVGKRSIGYSMTSLTSAKRFDGSAWVNLKVMKRFDGTTWKDITNI